MFQDFESTVPTVMLNYLTLLCCTLLSAHRHTQMNLGTCTGRRRRECIKQFRIFGNTVLAATVYDCFSFKSFDPSFHSPGAFSAMGTENCVVILVCNTKNWGKKKKHIQPNLLHRAVGSMHKIEKIRQLCNISEVSFREYNLLLKCSHLVKTLLS